LKFTRKPKQPFRLDFTSWVLRRLPENTIDRFQNEEYSRTVAYENQVFELSVSKRDFSENAVLRLSVTIEKFAPNIKTVASALADRLLGLNLNLSKFYRFASQDSKLSTLVEKIQGC
jgi:hypothetical protein